MIGWLPLAAAGRGLQATSSCWLVGVNIVRAQCIHKRQLEHGGFGVGYCEECGRLIKEIRKYELLWKSDHKDYGKHWPRMVARKKIALTLDRG